jgi:putative serine protease PepD
MKQRETPLGVTLFLIFILLLGFGLNFGHWLDIEYLHYFLRPQGEEAPVALPERIEELKQSIVNVRVQKCGTSNEWGSGTGFVVKSGYLATAAHVVQENHACGNDILVVDYKGVERSAELAGYSSDTDLAVLTFADTNLPPLKLADSTRYEDINELVKVVTIGYPLVGEASSIDKAAISGEGNISRFDPARSVFIISGMNLNPGNSGGPIFVQPSWEVLGVAVQKFDVTVGEGLGVVVPSKTFASFFRDKTGRVL